ncbi:MAG: C13 family peptidase, partial [Brevundimonas sp.]
TPTEAAVLMRAACGSRPTVAVVSACYSGVFIGALSGPNRMVMTAARPDRNSFGCGEDDVYPFFDACVIESLPVASDFIDLANRVRACVSRREAEEGAAPPSEPQVRIGRDMQLLLPLVRFTDDGGTPGS